MFNYLALIDNSETGSFGVAILFMFVIIALIIAVPAVIIGWILYHLTRGAKTRSSKNKTTKYSTPTYLPYVVGGLGVVIILANIAGSNYSSRSILFDTFLLTLPFLLAFIAARSNTKANTRKILLVGVVLSALIFLAYHFEI